MKSVKTIQSFNRHPSLIYDTPTYLYKMDNGFYFYADNEGFLLQVTTLSIRYNNAGDPFREYCTLDLATLLDFNSSTLKSKVLKFDLESDDALYLYRAGIPATEEAICRFKWNLME